MEQKRRAVKSDPSTMLWAYTPPKKKLFCPNPFPKPSAGRQAQEVTAPANPNSFFVSTTVIQKSHRAKRRAVKSDPSTMPWAYTPLKKKPKPSFPKDTAIDESTVNFDGSSAHLHHNDVQPQNCKSPESTVVESFIADLPVINFVAYLRSKEPVSRAWSFPENDWDKRSEVVKCLINLVLISKLLEETLFLAVSFLDRYLSSNPLKYPCNELPLLSFTCLALAAKLEENRESFCFKDLLSRTTTITFLRKFRDEVSGDGVSVDDNQVNFIAELCLLNQRCSVEFSPSVVAASILLINNPK